VVIKFAITSRVTLNLILSSEKSTTHRNITNPNTLIMSAQTWFISGASRGIGYELVKIASSNPNYTVFAGARNPSQATALQQLTTERSNVHLVKHEAASTTDAAAVAKTIAEVSGGLDVAIANAGIGTDWRKITEVDTDGLVEHLKVNSVGPLILFQRLYPLFLKRQTRKFIAISSMAGSITNILPIPTSVYGSSKATLNFLTRAIHAENSGEGFIAFPIHPGMANTDGGSAVGKLFRMEKLPMSPQESAQAVFHVVDTATSEQSGRFLNFDGTDLVW
jgi:NAD(P)-dependent dehydrogenase (short-subunit alcohol dehydrogenase family)